MLPRCCMCSHRCCAISMYVWHLANVESLPMCRGCRTLTVQTAGTPVLCCAHYAFQALQSTASSIPLTMLGLVRCNVWHARSINRTRSLNYGREVEHTSRCPTHQPQRQAAGLCFLGATPRKYAQQMIISLPTPKSRSSRTTTRRPPHSSRQPQMVHKCFCLLGATPRQQAQQMRKTLPTPQSKPHLEQEDEATPTVLRRCLRQPRT